MPLRELSSRRWRREQGCRAGTVSITAFWQANATDARGRPIDENLGGSLKRLRGFDPVTGRIEYIQTGPGGSAAVQNLSYQWDGVGNLTQRTCQKFCVRGGFHARAAVKRSPYITAN
jgi:hypothetical protein